jgi:2-polyprenyl-3-methyl-5-hydroxy-6-metoxy-1,4-benzoquinol methylase
MFPDIYSTEAYRYYGNGTGAYESIRVIQNARNNPNAMVKIYRAVPKSVKESHVRNGDWVTLSRDYAKDHGMSNINGGYRIIEEEVPARYLYTDGNSVNEFGYDDGRAYAYSNTKNNKKLLDEVTYDDEENPIPLSKRFDKRNKDMRYRDGEDTESIGEVNERFNEQLVTLTEKNADSIVFSLGRPSAILQSAGVENKPMKLYGNKVIKKMRKHGFALEELRDLPRAVADPIAVFNNYREDGNRSILTELHTANGNFLVTISLGKGKDDIDFNIVSSVFGKGETNIIDWLDRGLATYINKEKALNYLHHSALHAVTSDNPRLSSAAKLVENFENPKVGGIRNSETAREEGNENADDMKLRTSEELNSEYGERWLNEQTNEDGRHTTQVKNTINSYKKFGEWVKTDSNGRDVSVLDASSGLGLGTEWMRENGMSVDDVEPYPSNDRTKPTFTSYDEIDKKYDYIVSNAVLNVIPDDWRANVLHNMADKMKVGGKMVINVRGANSIAKQGKEGVTRITLDDPSEILVLRPDGTIKAYQKGFTKDELKSWCEKELGDGYSVEIATNKNAGSSYDTAVVVTKNNESGTIGVASEAGHPRRSAQTVPNSSAKLDNSLATTKELDKLSNAISKKGKMGAHEFLYSLSRAFGYTEESLKKSYYKDLGESIGIRIADHYANAENFEKKGDNEENYGVVVKLSPSHFKDKEGVDYLEYVYFPDKLSGERESEIVDGLKAFLQTGDFTKLPKPDKVNPSGRFKDELQKQIDGTLPEGHVYRMGMPGDILRSTGVPYLPIQMSAKKLQEKATMFGHDFDLSDVRDLVKALRKPLAVFAYGDKEKGQNIIVPLQKDGKNFLVGLSLNPIVGGRNLEINSIRNVFPKDNAEWLNWINQGKNLYLDKERIQTLIDQQRTSLADVEYLDLDFIAKVLEKPENSKGLGRNLQQAMADRVTELSESLNTPVRIVRTSEEAEQLPTVRQRKAKGSYNPRTGEVTVVLPNHADMDDVENTVLHEVVGHDGIRVLFPEEGTLNHALDELYGVSAEGIQQTIDGMAKKMYDAEVDRIRERKRKEHEAKGESVPYYVDMAEAHEEASKKKDKFRRDATEEYGANLAGKIGEGGFEKMSAEEQTFWGKLKAMLQRALQRLMDGLNIRRGKKWTDKEWAFVLHEAYKRKKNGGKPSVFDMADSAAMRARTGFGEGKAEELTELEKAHAKADDPDITKEVVDVLFRDGDDVDYEKGNHPK